MTKRVIVIGSGIIGAAIAWHLAKAGAAVTVIEAGDAGGLATRNSWAWINASWGKRCSRLARANEGCRHKPNQLIRQGLRQVFRQISLTFLRGALAQNTASFYLSSLLLGNPSVL